MGTKQSSQNIETLSQSVAEGMDIDDLINDKKENLEEYYSNLNGAEFVEEWMNHFDK